MCVSYENGSYFTFCPLGCIGWLSKRIPGSFYLVLGSQSCAFFLQSHNGFRMFDDMRFACAIVEESDINRTITFQSLTPVLHDLIIQNSVQMIFLMGSCVCDILKVDLKKIAQELASTLRIPVLPVKISGFDSIWTQGEDAVLSSLAEYCPGGEEEKERKVVYVGSLSSSVRKELLRESENLGIPVSGFLPSASFEQLPVINQNSLLVPLHPYLNRTIKKIQRMRKSKTISSLFPYGPDGTRDVFEKILSALNLPKANLVQHERHIWNELQSEIDIIAGKKIFFIGDSNLELALARFLFRAGADIVEIGTPFIHSQFLEQELKTLQQAQIPLVEAPDNQGQLARIQALSPDLIISPLSLAYPLEKLGYRVIWSIKFILPDIQGFTNAWRLLHLFTTPFKLDMQYETTS